jgi:L,D-transpeptidase YcbB
MKKRLLPLMFLLLGSAVSAPPSDQISWSADQLVQLQRLIAAAPEEGLNVATTGLPPTEAALRLANAYLNGCTDAQARAGWRIVSNDSAYDLPSLLADALRRNDLPGLYEALRPRSTEYAALRAALAGEADPTQRATLLRNMERWRWMPLALGDRYLLVNAAGFEVSLWEEGRKVAHWRVIVGKPKTPTPVFGATVTGVTVNPWWDIPDSIVAESVGRLVRTNPAEARRRGYVWANGSYRQRPGPNNALGQMKLVMPNPFNVYLHDTPNKALFDPPSRAFSHGCIRVGGALDLAGRLLGQPVEDAVETKQTMTLQLQQPLPVYIAYFTADVADDGTVELHPDIYGRDAVMGDSQNPVPHCPA